MSTITFQQRAQLQVRFLQFKATQLGIEKNDENLVELALRYGKLLAEKINSKFLVNNQ